MTINVNFTAVASSIAALSVSGVTIRDLDEIPTSCTVLVPCLIPKPDGYITNLSVTPDTYGTLGTGKLTLKYTLTYRYLHAVIGASLDFGVYNGLIANTAAILAAILALDYANGVQDMRVNTITAIGPVEDPAGNSYHGCDIVINIEQFCEVAAT